MMINAYDYNMMIFQQTNIEIWYLMFVDIY